MENNAREVALAICVALWIEDDSGGAEWKKNRTIGEESPRRRVVTTQQRETRSRDYVERRCPHRTYHHPPPSGLRCTALSHNKRPDTRLAPIHLSTPLLAMLVSTPTKPYVHRNAPRTSGVAVSPNFNIRHCTPPQSHSHYDSPMLSPSPLRHRPLFPTAANSHVQDSDDQFNSPFNSPALAHYPNPFYATKPQLIPADDEEGSIFLSSTLSGSDAAAPFFNPSSSPPLLTPVKQGHRVSSRPALAPVSINTHLAVAAPAADSIAASRVGVGTKRKSTPNITPLRPSHHIPLKVTHSKGGDTSVAFDRLAPLPAPKFNARTPQTKAETDAYLKRQTATLTRLRLNDTHPQHDEFTFDEITNDSGCEMDDDEESDHTLFLNKPRLSAKGGQFPKPLVFNSPLPKGKDKEEVAEAVSPGGHITKRRARSRPLSADLLEKSYRAPKSPIKHSMQSGDQPSEAQRPVAFPSTAHRGGMSPSSGSSSSSEAGSPRPRRRTSGGSNFAHPGAAHHPAYPPRPPLSRIDSVSAATLFFGPAIPVAKINTPAQRPMTRSRTSSTALSASQATAPGQRAPSQRLAFRHSYAGPDSGSVDLGVWNTLQTRDMPSPGSSPFGPAVDDGPSNTSIEMDDEDIFFAGMIRSN
ncbi:hypothetical protein BJ912DRAFT_1133257 [Pholiota molesta]|nr:hypothetical protein BJ912DRAFT_1133257 [Pholiota molesta]